MKVPFFFHLACYLWIFFSINFLSAAQALLDLNDIHKVMNKILMRHVDKRELSTETIKKSFQIYIDQFDPERMYLLQSEVDPFLNLDPSQVEKILKGYRSDQYAAYQRLNTTIQQAIKRARANRQELKQNTDFLFQKGSDSSSEDFSKKERIKSFPETKSELKKRTAEEFMQFIAQEKYTCCDQTALRAFDQLLRQQERFYLFTDSYGMPLPKNERENLFAMHILKALTKSLDSHTTYLDPDEAYEMKIRLEKGFHGIGVVLDQGRNGIVVSSIIENSPAERSGLVQAGDRIAKINGETVEHLSPKNLMSRLRGSTEKQVSLVLKREIPGSSAEQTIPVVLTRELIAIDEGRVEVKEEAIKEGLIGKIVIPSFYRGLNGITSENDLRKAIHALEKKGPLKGLILDLRENTGGFLNQAVKVAGLFITSGVVVISKYASGHERYFRDMDGKVSFDGPLIVLTSKATASAAEIVAQALQDYGVAIVVGDEQTYGKGTIQAQTVTSSNNSSHFKVTVGKYYTVSGKTPQVQGVKADIVVPSHYSHVAIGEEYLQHSLSSDTIPSSYKDALADIDIGLKPWYLRYYVPSLQKRQTDWKHLLPILKTNSEKRIASNQNYKTFLSSHQDPFAFQSPSSPNRLKKVDYQMQEAVNILKDMIRLEKAHHSSGIVDPL